MLDRLTEIAALFLKLGTIGFGGPAVHIATMEEEVVRRRRWVSHEQFLDLIGATNLIPGPNSTEMAIHLGYVRGGWRGLIVAGISFIVPAATITSVFAWLYVEFGQRPQLEPILAGIKPAVLAIIVSAGWRLGRKAITRWSAGLLALGVMGCSVAGMAEIPALLGGGVLGMLWFLGPGRDGGAGEDAGRAGSAGRSGGALLAAVVGWRPGTALAGTPAALCYTAVVGSAATPVSLGKLAVFFLKVGAVLYGTGYVLIAYLQGELVHDYGWLTEDQLFDAVAVGQLTPGPILSTATFIGYVVTAAPGNHLAGLTGAAVATLCIFLPSFLLVAATGPLVPRLRRSRTAAAFLDAVNAASLGLMGAVTLKLAHHTLMFREPAWSVRWPAVVIAAVAMCLVLRWNVSSVWLVIGGALAGACLAWVG